VGRKIPVILGGYVNGYSLARGFYETSGLVSYVLDYRYRISRHSRFVRFMESPNPGGNRFLEFLIDLGRRLQANGDRGVLIATNDEWMIPISQAKESLRDLFDVNVSDWSVIEKLTIKENFYALCDAYGVRYPATIVQKGTECTAAGTLRFPALCKASEVVEFINRYPGERRNRVFADIDGLTEYIRGKRSSGFRSPFIIQEYISGGAENLFTATTCSDSRGKVRAISVGRKLTQTPPEAGTITAGLVEWRQDVADSTIRLLDGLGLVGMANTEFKLDGRTGEFFAIETNPRPGMWNYSTLLSGVDMYGLLLEDPPLKDPLRVGARPVIWSITSRRGILGAIQDKELKERVRALIFNGEIHDPRECEAEKALYKAALALERIRTSAGHWYRATRRRGIAASVG